MSVEDVERILDETQESVEYQRVHFDYTNLLKHVKNEPMLCVFVLAFPVWYVPQVND